MLEGLQSESLKKFMNEVAEEIGISDYTETDKSRFPSWYHGAVGGSTSKLLNELGQKVVSETPQDQIRDLMIKYDLHVPKEVLDKAETFR